MFHDGTFSNSSCALPSNKKRGDKFAATKDTPPTQTHTRPHRLRLLVCDSLITLCSPLELGESSRYAAESLPSLLVVVGPEIVDVAEHDVGRRPGLSLRELSLEIVL